MILHLHLIAVSSVQEVIEPHGTPRKSMAGESEACDKSALRIVPSPEQGTLQTVKLWQWIFEQNPITNKWHHKALGQSVLGIHQCVAGCLDSASAISSSPQP